jgi:NET1-associated nuclear protein 1 (U3 small nucleolar RNA-associated protein 17)
MDEPVNMYLVIGHDYTKRNKHTYNDREDNFRVVHTSASFHQGEISKHVEVSKLRYARQTSAIWKSSQVQETFGDYMLVASGASILVWNVRERVSLGYLSTHVSSSPITCMTVCGERDMLITGNMKGEIVLWHSVSAAMNSIRKGDCAGLDTKKDSKLPQNASKFEVPTTKLHWHAHAVASLQMAPDNEHLYSAGEEGVLVLWQISTGTRTFIPRLGGAIAHISAS